MRNLSSNFAIVTINAYGDATKHIENHIDYSELHGYNYFEVINLYELVSFDVFPKQIIFIFHVFSAKMILK